MNTLTQLSVLLPLKTNGVFVHRLFYTAACTHTFPWLTFDPHEGEPPSVSQYKVGQPRCCPRHTRAWGCRTPNLTSFSNVGQSSPAAAARGQEVSTPGGQRDVLLSYFIYLSWLTIKKNKKIKPWETMNLVSKNDNKTNMQILLPLRTNTLFISVIWFFFSHCIQVTW